MLPAPLHSKWIKLTYDFSELESQNGLISKTQDESYRLAFYLGLAIPDVLEAGECSALRLLMKYFGIDGNPDLELMKMWSRVSKAGLVTGRRAELTADSTRPTRSLWTRRT
jgi:hypothetical protein